MEFSTYKWLTYQILCLIVSPEFFKKLFSKQEEAGLEDWAEKKIKLQAPAHLVGTLEQVYPIRGVS